MRFALLLASQASGANEMTCPICDQKPMNCDCTETERRQHAEIERLRLTDEERRAIAVMAHADERNRLVRRTRLECRATLCKLLERLQ